MKGFFEAMAPLAHPPLTVAHRFVESEAGLAYYTKRPDGLMWRSKELFDTPIYYLAFHGRPGAVRSLLERIEADKLCEAFAGYGGYRSDFNSSHAYFENLYLYYWLTGDSTVVETLRRGGESMRRHRCTAAVVSAALALLLLLCETAARSGAGGEDGRLTNPFTQQQIADITGQTSVNVNRVLADLERIRERVARPQVRRGQARVTGTGTGR